LLLIGTREHGNAAVGGHKYKNCVNSCIRDI